MQNTEKVKNIDYQVAKCIKQTEIAYFYYGFHIRMRKEVLIIISWEPLEYSSPGLEGFPYLPYIIDQWQEGEQYYTVLNHVRGVFFEDYMHQNRKFTEKELISLGLQICDILIDFEKRGVLATEIWNPNNVMLTPDFRICFLEGRGAIQKSQVEFVSKGNLKAAVGFMRFLCKDSKSIFSKVISKEFSTISELRKSLLDVIKRMPAYKKIKWKQRVLYGVLVCIFAVNVKALHKNALLYEEDTLLKAAISSFQKEEYEQAIVDYQNVLLINPDNIAARKGIAESYWNEGNIERAEECFRENVRDFQDEAGAVYLLQILENRALDSFTAGDYEKALEYYLELEKTNPNSKYKEMLFSVYLRQNDFENIKALIQQSRTQEINKDLMVLMEETYQLIERSEEAGAQLCKLADIIVKNDWLTLSEEMRTENFALLCEKYGGNTYCRYEGNIFVKLYKTGSIYLGEMEQDQRSGQGELVLLSKEYINIVIYSGEWSNDLPNGEGIQKAVILPYLREGREIWLSMEGNHINGYSDGKLFVQEYETVGIEKKVFRSITYQSDMGYLEPLKEYGDRGNIIGIWDTGEVQYSPHYNHIDSVAGLGLSECYFQFDKELD